MYKMFYFSCINCSLISYVSINIFREKNLDTVTVVDATHMEIKEQWRGRCVNSTSDLGSIYTFVFSPTPDRVSRSNCYYCVRFFVRTVNIIEKIESK